MLNAVPFLKHQFPKNRFDGFGGPGFVFLFQGVQGVVGVGIDDVRFLEVLSVLGEPVAERGGVCFVQVAPEYEAFAAFGIRAHDDEHVVDPPARAVLHGGEGMGRKRWDAFNRLGKCFAA